MTGDAVLAFLAERHEPGFAATVYRGWDGIGLPPSWRGLRLLYPRADDLHAAVARRLFR